MSKVMKRGGVVLSLLPALVLFAGCSGSQDSPKGGDKDAKRGQSLDKKAPEADHKDDTSDDGWWCNDHGIPEAECSMCSAKVENECKAKGDWCEKHNRARSQCFICEPKLKEKYAARYRAKYGKEPPPIKE